jgi:fucose permease
MVISAAAFFILGYCSITRNIAGIAGGFALLGIGLGLFQTPNNTAIMSALPAKHLSIASSVTATGRNLGMALGVSLGSILLSVQLATAGYYGEVVSADPSLLASSISIVMVLSGLMCVIVTILTLKR